VSNPYETRVAQLVKKLSVVPDPGLIEHLVRELLAERPSEVLAELMSTLGKMAQDEHARVAYCGVMRLCLSNEELPPNVREEVYSILAARGEGSLVRYLLPLPPLRQAAEIDFPGDPFLDEMTLGMRKWKARLHDRDLLARLSKDKNPSVVLILLDNPKTLERDIVVWAARRPARASALLSLAVHRKWSLRPKVQEAIARNPYAPAHVAASFIPLFPTLLLKQIRLDGMLHGVVRAAAEDILEFRKRSKSDEGSAN
jgi:hypothetical protein